MKLICNDLVSAVTILFTSAPDLIFPPPVIPTAPTVTDLSTVPASLVDHLYTALIL